MSTSKDYLNYLSEVLGNSEDIAFKPMMGEYLVYYRGKLVGDICDNRLLVKAVEAAARLLPDAERQLPYEGAKTPMILIENVDDGEFLKTLFEAMYIELPEPKIKKRGKKQ